MTMPTKGYGFVEPQPQRQCNEISLHTSFQHSNILKQASAKGKQEGK
jgi:hypothetical protein